MPAETCLKLPPNFPQREETRRFILAMGRRQIEPSRALMLAFMLWVEFASQGKEWRALTHAQAPGEAQGNPWDREELAMIIAQGVGWQETMKAPSVLIEGALESGFVRLEKKGDLSGLVLTNFAEWNPHLLPGYLTMHQKGQRAAAEARHRASDPTLARQQRELIARQGTLNLGELSPDITPGEIEAGIAFVMQLDRASGAPLRATAEYSVWMIGAAVRILREKAPKDVERLIDFLIEARPDPTVPKGAELVLQHVDKLLERSAL